ncbi:MAG: glycosyltransferase [Alphaproteobacteria bacterium]|nr:glycosyltransferase [Alphaproteobacteria bacterium]MBV8549054.1 glycosyltransferase [Alphaproteobacteria bacterium]
MSSAATQPLKEGCLPISAVVISYNRDKLIAAVLQAVQFCDEIILVDKSSTDATRDNAAGLYDRLVQVPWTPTADDTRSRAIQFATHDWVIMLDDDEILNPEAVAWIKEEMKAPRANVYGLPLKHYIAGIFDPNAYYWPERHTRFFRKGEVSFAGVIHGGFSTNMDKVFWIDTETGVAMEHLSHPSVGTWIEKTNRYTSCKDRNHPDVADPHAQDLVAFAKERLDFWVKRSHVQVPGDYPQLAAVLRGLYDIIDRLKVWEEDHGISGADMFAARAEELTQANIQARGGVTPVRDGQFVDETGGAAKAPAAAPVKQDLSDAKVLQAKLNHAQARLHYLECENRFYRNAILWRILSPVKGVIFILKALNRLLSKLPLVGRAKTLLKRLLSRGVK